jgi:hypothetical protein
MWALKIYYNFVRQAGFRFYEKGFLYQKKKESTYGRLIARQTLHSTFYPLALMHPVEIDQEFRTYLYFISVNIHVGSKCYRFA